MKRITMMKMIKILVLAAVPFCLMSPAYAGPWARGNWGWGRPLGVCSFPGWWPMGWAGFTLRLTFWALLIAGVVFLIKNRFQREPSISTRVGEK
jgi:hypothetical protein